MDQRGTRIFGIDCGCAIMGCTDPFLPQPSSLPAREGADAVSRQIFHDASSALDDSLGIHPQAVHAFPAKKTARPYVHVYFPGERSCTAPCNLWNRLRL